MNKNIFIEKILSHIRYLISDETVLLSIASKLQTYDENTLEHMYHKIHNAFEEYFSNIKYLSYKLEKARISFEEQKDAILCSL